MVKTKLAAKLEEGCENSQLCENFFIFIFYIFKNKLLLLLFYFL